MRSGTRSTLAVRAFQNMTQAIKFCPRPVVVAPYGMCLGGGAEIALHAAARHPHAELYMGLVEAGVGLIPAGGGSKEMLLRAIEAGAALRRMHAATNVGDLRCAQEELRDHRHG